MNVEIASDHYHAAAIVAKAGAGFAMHGSSQSASQKIAGDDPGMPRHVTRERKARARPLGLRGRKSTAAHKEPSR